VYVCAYACENVFVCVCVRKRGATTNLLTLFEVLTDHL